MLEPCLAAFAFHSDSPIDNAVDWVSRVQRLRQTAIGNSEVPPRYLAKLNQPVSAVHNTSLSPFPESVMRTGVVILHDNSIDIVRGEPILNTQTRGARTGTGRSECMRKTAVFQKITLTLNVAYAA